MATGGEARTRTASYRGAMAGALIALVVAAGIAVARQRAVPDLVVQSDEGWAGEVRVAVAGEVMIPGTYALRSDARLADVIAAAGGYTESANRDVLNLAACVGDGQSYTVPLQPTPAPRAATSTVRAAASARAASPASVVSAVSAPSGTSGAPGSAVTGLQTAAASLSLPAPPPAPVPMPMPTSEANRAASAAASIAANTVAPGPTATVTATATSVSTANRATARVNLNTGTRAELESLPLIGPALADRILQDRAANGPYRTVDDLARVRGISPRTVEQLRDRLTV